VGCGAVEVIIDTIVPSVGQASETLGVNIRDRFIFGVRRPQFARLLIVIVIYIFGVPAVYNKGVRLLLECTVHDMRLLTPKSIDR
jgi:hypothetical protein